MGHLGGPVVHRQKNPPNLGRMGCVSWLVNHKRPMTEFCFWQFYVPIICIYDPLSLDLLELFFTQASLAISCALCIHLLSYRIGQKDMNSMTMYVCK